MPNRRLRFSFGLFCCLLVLALAAGCDEQTLGPETQGSIEGVVRDTETNDPLARANVTTSPPTQSVLTNENGEFKIEDIPTGDYSIEVTKNEFEARSVRVKVQENETTNAEILLERTDKFGAEADSLTAQVTNWYNDRINRDSTGADSIFVGVEYSVRNVGDVSVRNYEVYFEIDTPEGVFTQEVVGDSLAVSQRDLGGFRKFVRAEAQEVRVDDLFWETGSD